MIGDNQWDSVISFQSDISVKLSGTLDLDFADGVDTAAQIGRTIHLFDWSGVLPIGAFDIGGPYTWDVSQLYTSGDVTLTAVPEPAGVTLSALEALATALGIAIHKKLRTR